MEAAAFFKCPIDSAGDNSKFYIDDIFKPFNVNAKNLSFDEIIQELGLHKCDDDAYFVLNKTLESDSLKTNIAESMVFEEDDGTKKSYIFSITRAVKNENFYFKEPNSQKWFKFKLESESCEVDF